MQDSFEFSPPQEFLESLFPSYPKETLLQILVDCNYNLETVFDYIYQEKEQSPSNITTTTTTTSKKQVCRHFLAGGCYRKDCWFSHDLEATICKYWLQGNCMKGEACTFSHGNYQRVVMKPEPRIDDQVKTMLDLSNAFPSLPYSDSTQSSAVDFLSVNYASLRSMDTNNSSTSSNGFPLSMSIKPGSMRKNTKSVDKKVKVDDVPWVATGDTLSSTYNKHRQEAIQVAILRNKLFQNATEAYLSGNKAAAKKFSLEAHELNKQLDLLHQNASDRIFEERNYKPDLIDLHGLHENEVVGRLERGLLNAKNMRLPVVRIITGTGHHSRLGRASIEPIVAEYLAKWRHKWAQGKMPDGRSGLFTVYLHP